MIEMEHSVRPRYSEHVISHLENGHRYKVLGNLGETALQIGEMPSGDPVLWHPPERDMRIVDVGELVFFNGPNQLKRRLGNEPGMTVLYGQAHFPEDGDIVPTNYSRNGGVSAYDVAQGWPLNRSVVALMFDRRFSDPEEHFEQIDVGLFSVGRRVIGVMNNIPTGNGHTRPVDASVCRQDEAVYKEPTGTRKLVSSIVRKLDRRLLTLDERSRFIDMLPDHITGRDLPIILREHNRFASRSSIEAIRSQATNN